MHYIGWIETIWKVTKIKRISNNKWYNLTDVLENIKSWYDNAYTWKLKGQYLTEYKEIAKICFVFSVKIPTDLKCKERKQEE